MAHIKFMQMISWWLIGWTLAGMIGWTGMLCAVLSPSKPKVLFCVAKKKYLGPISSIKQGANLISAQAVATGM